MAWLEVATPPPDSALPLLLTATPFGAPATAETGPGAWAGAPATAPLPGEAGPAPTSAVAAGEAGVPAAEHPAAITRNGISSNPTSRRGPRSGNRGRTCMAGSPRVGTVLGGMA